MNEKNDTVKLLRGCSSGVKMALDTVNNLLDYAKTPALKNALRKSVVLHEKMSHEISLLLLGEDSTGDEPGAFSKVMAKGQITAKMLMNDSDSNVAHIIVDGCTMGITQISEYKNEYRKASAEAKAKADELIVLEENFSAEMRAFL